MVQPDPRLLRWVTECVVPGASVVSVTGLRRGESPWLVKLSSTDVDEVVVRVGDESSIALLATEVAALEAIAASDVPGPRLLGVAMGGPTAPGLFGLVMTRVPGTSRSAVEPSTARLRALGEAVAMVHAAPIAMSPHLPPATPPGRTGRLRRRAPVRAGEAVARRSGRRPDGASRSLITGRCSCTATSGTATPCGTKIS